MSDVNAGTVCHGQCLCGAVRFRLGGPFQQMVHCHCSMCRKAHGSAFATFVAAPAAGFEWLSGLDDIVAYESTPGNHRYFCRHCGAVCPAPAAHGDLAWVPAGALVEDCGARPEAHMFADSRAAWIDVDDGLTVFPDAPPGYEPPAATEPARADPGAPPGGGCLCGDVRYEIRGEPLVMVNCHCSRCRLGRSAAHATNLFVLPEQLHWLAGKAKVTVFDLPGAERFGIDFCPRCGGCVPRSSAKIGRVNLPAGSLDGDPGMAPSHHIFVASRAPWFEIRDGVPQHLERAPA